MFIIDYKTRGTPDSISYSMLKKPYFDFGRNIRISSAARHGSAGVLTYKLNIWERRAPARLLIGKNIAGLVPGAPGYSTYLIDGSLHPVR